MKQQGIDLMKGTLIGVANVVPGLSGGTIAVVLGVYDKLINALKDLFDHPWQTIKAIWGLIIGIIIGIAVSVLAVVHLLALFPLPMTFLFIGMIVGALPSIYEETNHQKKTRFDYSMLILMALVIILMPFLPENDLGATLSVQTIVILFIVGVIAASTMVIPGISGSMILIAIGYYFYITESLGEFITHFFQWNWPLMASELVFLIPFGLGVLVGIVLIARLISKLLKTHRKTVYCAIVGLLIASPFSIMFSTLEDFGSALGNPMWLHILASGITLALGVYFSLLMVRIGKQNE